MLRDQLCPVRRITPEDGRQYFYGYYDNPAFTADGSRHLCHRVDFLDRLPAADDVCALGLLETGHGRENSSPEEQPVFKQFAETTLWNFQQGSMLQFLSGNDDIVAYNTRDINGGYRCAIHNLTTGHIRFTDRAAANISKDGRWALSINFDRLFDFRPGYGYSGKRDPFYDEERPEKDGIYLTDMESGTSKLILSYDKIAGIFEEVSPLVKNSKLLVNHITFNPSAERFVFLVRSFPKPDKKGWLTGVATADREGKNVRILMEFSMASHYHWRDDNHLLIWGRCAASGNIPGMLLIEDAAPEAGKLKIISPELFVRDIHCIYSPDLKFIAGDGYPDSEQFRPLYVYNVEKKSLTTLLRAWSMSFSLTDNRCDLHNRWSPDGTQLSFDSTHEGFRGVYIANLDAILRRT
ncbi:MAG: hypothetical protein PHG48_06835 [Eubacteriales bacterium]|nr:hypothetical protein [Eubacteriales bacterium]